MDRTVVSGTIDVGSIPTGGTSTFEKLNKIINLGSRQAIAWVIKIPSRGDNHTINNYLFLCSENCIGRALLISVNNG